MSRIETLRPEFVEFIPGTLQGGILYISQKYKTASHLCCCGCGCKVVTPLNPSGWQLTEKRGRVSLSPSIGNWSFPCQSHYWIRGGRVEWAAKWSREEIEAGRRSDLRARQIHFDTPRQTPSIGQRFVDWLKGLVQRIWP
ncbi:MAG: DUF6527 family protein [Xanthobacteraceae bacterium]|nr:DUF6527 family protein [Xanthobacteraceae bacterium]